MLGGTAQDWQNVGPYGVYRRTGGDYLFLWRCRSNVQRGAAGVASTCQVLFVRLALGGWVAAELNKTIDLILFAVVGW